MFEQLKRQHSLPVVDEPGDYQCERPSVESRPCCEYAEGSPLCSVLASDRVEQRGKIRKSIFVSSCRKPPRGKRENSRRKQTGPFDDAQNELEQQGQRLLPHGLG